MTCTSIAFPSQLGRRGSAQRIHLTQIRSRFNREGVSVSNDCGPTCLAMAITRYGRWPTGSKQSAQERIDSARGLMFTDADGIIVDQLRCGFRVDQQGNRRPEPSHRMTLSNPEDLIHGARNAGLEGNLLSTLDELQASVSCGEIAILAGNVLAPHAYGQRLGIHYQGGHFVLASAYSFETKRWIINDPLSCKGPLLISQPELEGFLGDPRFGTMVVLRRASTPLKAATEPPISRANLQIIPGTEAENSLQGILHSWV